MMGRSLDRRVSWTAQAIVAHRAAETLQHPNRRILEDPYSRHFVRDLGLRAGLINPLAAYAFIALGNLVFPGVHDFTVLRTRYTDDVFDAAQTDGIDQLVLLGAGFDTTGVRRASPHMKVFEVDAPATQQHKRTVLERLQLADYVRQTIWVSCDFEHDAIDARLIAEGFDPTRPSLIMWIGVSEYLTRHAFDTTLASLATLCASGSQLVFDYVDADVVSGNTQLKGARRAVRAVELSGEPFRTGFTAADLDALLAAHGFRCREHVRMPELLQRYVPTHTSRQLENDWVAITTAQRT